MKNYILKINNAMQEFNPIEARIAEFFVSNQTEMMRLPIQKIAESCSCSQSAIVRFCQSLGYSGFKDFRRQVTESIIEQNSQDPEQPAQYSDIKLDGPLNTIVDKITNNNVKSLQDTASILDERMLIQAIHAVAKSNKLVFYGVGGSGIAAADAYQKFVRLGKNCQYFEDTHLQLASSVTLKQGDVAVLISYSGRTKDILDLLHVFQEANVTTIAITKYGNSPLSKGSDIVLHVVSTDIPMRSASFSSRIAQLSVVDMLFTGVASLNYDELKIVLEKGYLLCEKKKQEPPKARVSKTKT